jgi:hypothetical protein
MACWLGGRCLSVCYTVLGAWSRSESVSCSMLMPAGTTSTARGRGRGSAARGKGSRVRCCFTSVRRSVLPKMCFGRILSRRAA